MNFQIEQHKKVLVTGGTGFIAGWIIKQLVEAGVCVHATVRDPDNEEKVAHLKKLSKKGPGEVILFKADLLEPESFNTSISDCNIVFHTASPFLFKFNDPQKDFLEPALDGTKNILKAVNSTPSVEKVVLTSSCTAIYGDAEEIRLAPNNTITEACSRELHRGGQIFVVHNDIDTIDNMAESLRELMPNIKIRIAHGQMPSKELEQIMTDFYHQRFQILVCTTIIETGIDIPSANTIIINNAQNFGLAQLHQLRGRVGRSHHKAYAYLVIKSHQSITDNARKRLDAIASLEELGAGFMLANHDLEIRGAGDLLGENQSGKISEIGFNLYHDLLKRTIHAIKNNYKLDIKDTSLEEIEINPGIACIIPETYLPDVHERLILYKRIASAEQEDELKELKVEMIDRFGPLPEPTQNLFESSSLKNFSQNIGILKINIYDDKAEITLNDSNSIDTAKIINLIQTKPQQFQLKNQKTLVINEVMEADQFRIKKIGNIVKSLV